MDGLKVGPFPASNFSKAGQEEDEDIYVQHYEGESSQLLLGSPLRLHLNRNKPVAPFIQIPLKVHTMVVAL